MPANGEEARVELAVGRQPRPRAVAAERLCDGGDDADLAAAVAIAISLRDLAAVRSLDRLERQLGVDGGDDLGGRYDVVEPPAVRVSDVHVLDEAERVTCGLEVAGELEDRAVVEPSLDDDVHLDGEPLRRCCVDAFEHPRDREVDVVHRAEDVVVERVEAHGDARQAGAGEALCLPREQRAVRREREIDVAERRELAHEHRQVAAHEGLAAGDADLLDASFDEDTCDPLDLLERQKLLASQELVLAAEDLLRHAVDAPEVAAVGDRDAQIPQRTAKCVGQ